MEFETVMRTAALAGIALFSLLLVGRGAWAWRGRGARAGAKPVFLRLSMWLRAGALLLCALGLLQFLFVLQRGTMFMPAHLQALLALALVGYFAVEITISLRGPGAVRRWLWWSGTVVALAAGALGLLLVQAAWRAFDYPPVADSVVLDRVPFAGEWAAAGAGASGATNHHDRIPSQKYAADLAAVCDDGRLFREDGARQEDSCTFGTPVLAPVDGEVVVAVDGHADGASRRVLPGNHVVIRIDEGRYVALAHFRQGSVQVAAGDRVRAGQVIAEAGNSGNSDFAHLHIHVQDTAEYDIRTSRALPWRLAAMERKRYLWWSRVEDGFLLSNDRVRPARE